jgi:hypothetical protein
VPRPELLAHDVERRRPRPLSVAPLRLHPPVVTHADACAIPDPNAAPDRRAPCDRDAAHVRVTPRFKRRAPRPTPRAARGTPHHAPRTTHHAPRTPHPQLPAALAPRYVPAMSRSTPWRLFAVLWAVLQFALPGVALVADAQLERGGEASVAHVESGSSKGCRPTHPDACVLCQLLSRAASPAASPGLPPLSAEVASSPAMGGERVARGERSLVALPRAPPTVG